ncbi:hypothetical protein [Pseudomonas glycinae]|uniref:hypothetical protein n=1 Tax=Pseudomonas glycinae TaxID=1785145 RepID=UPI00167C5B3D|nr:hypothetical protein [Pseudomonas glycinae]
MIELSETPPSAQSTSNSTRCILQTDLAITRRDESGDGFQQGGFSAASQATEQSPTVPV